MVFHRRECVSRIAQTLAFSVPVRIPRPRTWRKYYGWRRSEAVFTAAPTATIISSLPGFDSFPRNESLKKCARQEIMGLKKLYSSIRVLRYVPGRRRCSMDWQPLIIAGLSDFMPSVTRKRCGAEMAKKLSLAGFTQLEVGLQSIKASTLKRIHRRFHPRRFLDGIKYLQDGGIKVMVDVIAGLPGDILDDVRRSLDWVLEHSAYDFLILYPLSLLPATELRQRCRELGLSAMSYPPIS